MQNAQLYHRNNSVQKQNAAAFLEEYKSQIKWQEGNKNILDIGCGDGRVTVMMKNYFPRDVTFLGCDISENMVNFANEHYQDDKTSFIVLDIVGELPENYKGHFGKVFSFYALHWVMDQERAFKNILDLLGEGGECFLAFHAWCPFFDVFRLLAQREKWKVYLQDVEKYISPYHDSLEPEKKAMKIMKDIGFVDISITLKETFCNYGNLEAMRNAMAAIIPFNIPKTKHDDFMDEFITLLQEVQYVDIHTTEATKINYKVLIISGHKPAVEAETFCIY